jgi:3-oxoacyl-[acyl-carrier-protein] synthase II
MQLGRLASGEPIAGRRVVVTGYGAVTCCGVGAPALFDGLLTGQFNADRSIPDFDPGAFFGPKEVRRVDRFAQVSLAAAVEAAAHAALPDLDGDRLGVVFGTGIGGMTTLTAQERVLSSKGAKRVSPFLAPMIMPNAGAAQIAMRLGANGPVETVTTACAAGTHSLGAAARLVASGRVDVAIGGGGESVMDPLTFAGFANMTALSSSGLSRPFDVDRDGFVMSEGAGALVLESLEHATARGATIHAEILGAASTADAFHITAPRDDGRGAARCMALALLDAGLDASEIGHINAHGTSTPLNDAAEAIAIHAVFGDAPPPVTSAKGVTGHSLGGAGAIEAVASVMTIEQRLIPPTAGVETVDPTLELDVVVGAPRAFERTTVLSNSFGFGGHNGCVILAAAP